MERKETPRHSRTDGTTFPPTQQEDTADRDASRQGVRVHDESIAPGIVQELAESVGCNTLITLELLSS